MNLLFNEVRLMATQYISETCIKSENNLLRLVQQTMNHFHLRFIRGFHKKTSFKSLINGSRLCKLNTNLLRMFGKM